ncbi:ArsR family transcriptional regulator [Pseudoduganella flava]|uniref:ArsR family transcriptional regulator n=1 Tax=Pseudoduganella flava TaxID=871742 RepID=A0A562Q4P9_9BURK|nr:metalloregulator ArsR/SmtB family transcription factor [Pseudoduganella flava]QGZ41734.1 metalloregulator ArsR/SmtB family transcription factor [Pseudoduganella flava]TWI51735.1 ArsR family transcriptional regulator [Pseudoduganella flava]
MDQHRNLDLAAMQAAAAQACGLLKTLANPDRLLLLCQLTQGEYCVSDLAAQLGIGQPTLSQQLGVLRNEGLVATRRDGKQIYYRLASDDAAAVMQVLYARFCAPGRER